MNLSSKALLVQLSISQWAARKYDKRVSNAVAASSGASNDAGRYNKVLLPNAAKLEALQKKAGSIRTEYYRQTLPWGLEGTMLLPTDNYMKFMSEFKTMKAEWEVMVNDFITGYPQLVSAAQTSLGAMYDAADYPDVNTIRDRFRMNIVVMPVPSTDFRVALGDEELDKIRADVEQRVTKAGESAMADLWQRLYDRVKILAERLADPEARIHQSLFENAEGLCEILPRLNIADDPKLEQMRVDLQSMIKGRNAEMLRHSPTAREETAKNAQAIVDKMSTFMGGIA